MAELQPPILPTYLYRYRSLDRDRHAMKQEMESIVENYLYCSEFTRMNDPMEGFYRPSRLLSKKSNYKDIFRKITDNKSGIGIACFTETYEDVLMWTHYAGNYKGMCIKYSSEKLLNGLPKDAKLVRLSYVDKPPLITVNLVSKANDAAIRILSQKKYNWAYEREWRVLGPVGVVRIGRVQAVEAIYFGSRVSLVHRDNIIENIAGTDIKAFMMEIDGYDHHWEQLNKTT